VVEARSLGLGDRARMSEMASALVEPWAPRFDSISLTQNCLLGRGAFGEVFRVIAHCTQKDTSCEFGAAFALKRTPLVGISKKGLESAQAEAKLLQRLGAEHDSIIKCFDFRIVHVPSPTLELLLEFAPLGDLNDKIQVKKNRSAGREGDCGLPEAEVVAFGCDVAAGLAHIHALRPKVLHRDVKPANVVLFPTGVGGSQHGMPRAKLADFGIAKVLESNGSTAEAATVIGTPHYLSPEICRGETYDERSDAWALGCVLYEMLCLHRPFHQAERNIAALALRVMEGRYDKDALERRAGHYNGLLIFTLFGLLAPASAQRHRAADALHSLGKLRMSAAGIAVPWWLVDTSVTQVKGNARVDADDDSWAGAKGIDVGVDVEECPSASHLRQMLLSECTALPTALRALTPELTCLPASPHGKLGRSSLASEDGSAEATQEPSLSPFLGQAPLRYPSLQTEYLIESLEAIPEAPVVPDAGSPCGLASMGDGIVGLLVSEPPGAGLEAAVDVEMPKTVTAPQRLSPGHAAAAFDGAARRAPVCRPQCEGIEQALAPRIFMKPYPGSLDLEQVDSPVVFCFAPHTAHRTTPVDVVLKCGGAVAFEYGQGWLEVELSMQTADSPQRGSAVAP